MILYGAPVREKIKKDLISLIEKLGRKPVLAIVQIGDRADSNIYIKQKQKFAEEIGAKVVLKKFEETIEESEVLVEITKLNKDGVVDGIIVQLPLPKNFDTKNILNSIDPKKDADGLRSQKQDQKSTDKILLNFSSCLPQSGSQAFSDTVFATTALIPATARAVLSLLDFYKISVSDKKVAVIGQGALAGRPIADLLEGKGARVVRCDINTKNIPALARGAHILISAVGKAGLITKDFINESQIVVDVGICRILDETGKSKIVGDVDFPNVSKIVRAITPVPGGVGPLTVACLFQNLIDLSEK